MSRHSDFPEPVTMAARLGSDLLLSLGIATATALLVMVPALMSDAAPDRIRPPALTLLRDGNSNDLEASQGAVPDERALDIRECVAFFQTVRAAIIKAAKGKGDGGLGVETAIQQLVSKAISTDQVVDIFAAAGLAKPDVSILSDEFLAEVRDMPYKNLAVELLKKLLNDEIKTRFRRNAVLSRSFSEMLAESIRRYQNRTIEAAKVIAELIELARDMREAGSRGDKLKLSEDEVAFYDALEANDSAVMELGDDTLKAIARELIATVRKNVTIDWAIREQARAKLRVLVKRVLRKYNYPPDKTEAATDLVIEQAELICGDMMDEAV